MDMKLEDKVVLITGASRGIGLATARAFVREGCRVAICARGADALELARQQLSNEGACVVAVQADVCQPDQAARCVQACVDELGGLDVLVNNAYGLGVGRSVMDATDADWVATFEGCLFQAVRMARLAVPHMRGRDGAAIVNVGSMSGWSAQLAPMAPYGAAKAALIFLTERLALELVRDGIRVNTVSPGSILGKGSAWDRLRQEDPDAVAQFVADSLPMGRMGTPDEVADAIVFVASHGARWINGRHIAVDGLQQPTATGRLRIW